MKIITYKCNLCDEVKDRNDLYKYYYGFKGIEKSFVLKKNDRSLEDCDRHLCKDCVAVIKAANICELG